MSHLYLDTATGIYYARGSNVQGRDFWRSLETKVFSVAKARLIGKIAEIQAGRTFSVHHDLETFGHAAAVYFGRVKADVTLKPRAVDYGQETIEALLRSWPGLGDRRPSSISADECLAWAAGYQERISDRRFNSTVDSLRHIFNVAIEAGLIIENPAAKIGKVKVKAKRLKLPSREEFHALIVAMRAAGGWCSQEAAHLVEFLSYSGCRIDESCYVTWKDVDGAAGESGFTATTKPAPRTGNLVRSR